MIARRRQRRDHRFLQGQTCLVTGASRGLGAAIATRLARTGANVVLTARSADLLAGVEERVRAAGARAISVPADVSLPADREEVLRRAEAAFGQIDVLVNNAGTLNLDRFDHLGAQDIDRVIAVNLSTTLQLTRIVVPGMLERRHGRVVTISSMAARVGTPFDVVYAATKAGQIAATHALRAEYHGAGVQFSVVCPGWVRDTGMWHDSDPPETSWILGSTTSAKVATAVLTALREDSPEIYVNSPPSRPLLALGEWSPRLREFLLRRMGLTEAYARAARVQPRARGD